MPEPLGRRRWAIPEGMIPSESTADGPDLESHETASILNVGDDPAQVQISLFFVDREPVGPYRVEVPARRTRHLRFNELEDPEPVPRDTDYASLIESDVPIIVQHTRLDSRQPELAIMTSLAYPSEE
ncbi:MAG TPA: sensory rhodopsin transducer [Candidatus Limnocylindrales bacterium]|jgi:hypothetical protein|nr:sensory rhodopsin transducer [Candidatus Limnocylindrales bacterium]